MLMNHAIVLVCRLSECVLRPLLMPDSFDAIAKALAREPALQ